MNEQFNRFNPRNARTIDELEKMQHDYENLLIRQQNLESLSRTQNEITNEMSQYGSNLIPTLTTCGVVGCLGVTGCLLNKYCGENHHGHRRHNNDVNDQIPRSNQYYIPEVIDLTGDDEPSEEFLFENIKVKQEPK